MGDRDGACLAHFLWPPVWIGRPPARRGAIVDVGELADVVVEAELADGLCGRAYRDGMVAFGLDARLGVDPERVASAARVINAHLACLQARVGRPWRARVATPWTVFEASFSDPLACAVDAGADAGTTLALVEARDARRRPAATDGDWRFTRPLTLEQDAVRRSFACLAELLARPRPEVVLLRTELLCRARAALDDLDHGAALTNAWTTIEGLIGDRLGSYLDGLEGRPADGDARFMNHDRRRWLTGSEVDARMRVELLSLADQVPFPLYRDIVRCGRVRNDWLHRQEQVAPQDATMAIRAAQRLLALVEGVELALPAEREGIAVAKEGQTANGRPA